MRKPKGALLIVLLSVAAVLTACNGSNNGGFPGPGPTQGPSGNCGGPPSSNQLEVLFPVPNSRNAPPGTNNIYVSTKSQLPPSNQFDFLLSESTGSSTFTGPFTGIDKSQLPAGAKKPTYSNAVYYASAIAGPSGSSFPIGPDVAVSLFWNDGGRNCVPHFLVASFRTKKT
jgi:hypothetical protein